MQLDLDFTPMGLKNLPHQEAMRNLVRWYVSYGLPDVEPLYITARTIPSIWENYQTVWAEKHLTPTLTAYMETKRLIRMTQHHALTKVPLILVLPHLNPKVAARCQETFERPKRVWLRVFNSCSMGVVYTAKMDTPEYILYPDTISSDGSFGGLTHDQQEQYHGNLWLARVVNGTPEPDGRYKVYWIRVHPINGGHAGTALGLSYGIPEGHYNPMVRT